MKGCCPRLETTRTMALLTLHDACLASATCPCSTTPRCRWRPGERLGLIGRNGTGKSSLLKILAGLERPDDGLLQLQQGLRRLYVAAGAAVRAGRHGCSRRSASEWPRPRRCARRYEAHAPRRGSRCAAEPHRGARRLDLGAAPSAPRTSLAAAPAGHERMVDTLSGRAEEARGAGAGAGGGARRAAAGRADQPPGPRRDRLAGRPADATSGQRWSLITHDRAFLDRVATRIVELDRGTLRSYPGDFADYLARKEEQLARRRP